MATPDADHAAPEDVPLSLLLREDLAANGGLAKAGFHAVAVHRLGCRTATWGGPLGKAAHTALRVLQVCIRNVYGIELAFTVRIGRRLRLAHQGGIVIHDFATIGNDCLLRHGVTLGAKNTDREDEVPVLGDRVQVGPNAVVMGAVVVGDDARIGPLALVTRDVPSGGRALAPLATITEPERIRSREDVTAPG
jgi:serine O-acetyltransferase